MAESLWFLGDDAADVVDTAQLLSPAELEACRELFYAVHCRLTDFRRHRILLPRNRPPGSMWARLAERLRGRFRELTDDIDDFAAVLDLVSAGAGLLPAPHLLVDTIRRHDIRFVPLDGAGLRLMYGLSWSHERTSAELMTLVQTVHEVLRTR